MTLPRLPYSCIETCQPLIRNAWPIVLELFTQVNWILLCPLPKAHHLFWHQRTASLLCFLFYSLLHLKRTSYCSYLLCLLEWLAQFNGIRLSIRHSLPWLRDTRHFLGCNLIVSFTIPCRSIPMYKLMRGQNLMAHYWIVGEKARNEWKRDGVWVTCVV